ncbi:MAG: hypothetical protein M0017_13255 [Desulfobacteraceae bacterium]|nr:hypothetical protein [Desulfobacteraceae bacterium]
MIPQEITTQLAALYAEMEAAYDDTARAVGLSCRECPDNCCDSFFYHHTYLEWAYLWEGVNGLPAERREEIVRRAEAYEEESGKCLARGERPQLMCPVNEGGLCVLYPHRLMICRLHGVPSALTRPDGQALRFPGCFRCQEIAGSQEAAPLDRTPLLQRLARLEMEWLGPRRHVLPKMKMTIAGMLVEGEPGL